MKSADDSAWEKAHRVEQVNWDGAIRLKELDALRTTSLALYSDMMELGTANLSGKTILDIGGGYTSMLTAFFPAYEDGVVVDPAEKKKEIVEYYSKFRVIYIPVPAEEYLTGIHWMYDEIWMYNCLKHTIDPELILRSLPNAGKVLRIAELTDTIQDDSHPHILTKEWLTEMLEEISTERSYHEEHRDVRIHPNNTLFHLDSFGGVFKLKEVE